MAYIILDTETANSLECPFCYDIGWAIIDENFEILKTRSFVVADIFLEESELMQTAYYSEKLPKYWEDIREGKRALKTFRNIRKILWQDCLDYEVRAIVAHNARFDYCSCNTTQRYLTSSKYRYFFPKNVEIWCSLRMARQTFGENKEYKDFCKNNGYITKSQTPRLTAEILYRFLTNDISFEESHTGLEDVLIEKEIFKACLKINPEINCRAWD